MKSLRTPDERFENLPDFDFAPNYVEIGDLRMHYVDEGPRDGEIVLLLHGEPTWSFLYRHMIPVLTQKGLRAIAPDLIGFGRSDKPADVSDYTFDSHIEWIDQFVTKLDLNGMTLFGQDWGSLIGLRYAAENPDRFARIVIANGFLPFGEGKVPAAFRVWRKFARWTPKFPTSRIVQSATVRVLSADERAAYDAPFPKEKFKAGARAFPQLVPVEPDNPAVPACRAAWDALGAWQKPFLTLFGSRDPIFRGLDKKLHEHIPGTNGQPHQVLSKAGHFIQEDRGPELADATAAFVALTSAVPA